MIKTTTTRCSWEGNDGPTPASLCEEIVSLIPEEDIANPEFTMFDGCAGTGGFGRAFYDRRVEYLDPAATINTIYLNDLNVTRHRILRNIGFKNLAPKKTDSLTYEHMKHRFTLSNYPFTTNGKGKTTIYPTFTKRDYDRLEEGGMLFAIFPRAWFTSQDSKSNGGAAFRKWLYAHGLKYVKALPVRAFANVKTRTCYIQIIKGYTGSVTICNDLGDEYELESTDNNPCIFVDKIMSDIMHKVSSSTKERFKLKSFYKNLVESDKIVDVVDLVTGPVGDRYCKITKGNMLSEDSDTWRIVHAYRAGRDRSTTQFMGLLRPGVQNKKGYVQQVCSSEEEAKNLLSLLNTKVISYVFDNSGTSNSLDTPQFAQVPKLGDRLWTDESANKFFNLTDEEIEVVMNHVVDPQGR